MKIVLFSSVSRFASRPVIFVTIRIRLDFIKEFFKNKMHAAK